MILYYNQATFRSFFSKGGTHSGWVDMQMTKLGLAAMTLAPTLGFLCLASPSYAMDVLDTASASLEVGGEFQGAFTLQNLTDNSPGIPTACTCTSTALASTSTGRMEISSTSPSSNGSQHPWNHQRQTSGYWTWSWISRSCQGRGSESGSSRFPMAARNLPMRTRFSSTTRSPSSRASRPAARWVVRWWRRAVRETSS